MLVQKAGAEVAGTAGRNTILAFAATSLAAVALGSLTMAATGVPASSWLRHPAAWLFGLVLAALVSVSACPPWLARALLVLAPAWLAATFLFPAQEGVHRWIDLGPLHINAAALLLPPAIVSLALTGIRTPTGFGAAAVIAVLLILQPDASQAAAFAAAAVILLLRSPDDGVARLAAGAALLGAAAAWLRPDPLQPVPEVEEIFALALTVSPSLTAAALLALAAASLSPLLHSGSEPRRSAALALAGYFAVTALSPALDAFPVPLVGLGMSFPVGWWLGIGLLCTKSRSVGAAA